MAEKHVHRGPHPDVDVATFVLASLDGLLTAQAEIRRQLAPGRMAEPAERWHLAAASMVAARRYAADLAVALGAARPAEPRSRASAGTRDHSNLRTDRARHTTLPTG